MMLLSLPGGGVCDHPWIPDCARIARTVAADLHWADDRVLAALAETAGTAEEER